jgi:hypothetical protein
MTGVKRQEMVFIQDSTNQGDLHGPAALRARLYLLPVL